MKYLKTFEKKGPKKEVKYHDNGNIKSISYILDGNKHRDDGPAYQYWYDNGKKGIESYYINGELHREEGVAYLCWYDNGQLRDNGYYINGIQHREDGPAETIYFKNGELVKKSYYFNNNEYDRKEWIEKLKEINSPHYKEQKELYEIEKNIKKYNL